MIIVDFSQTIISNFMASIGSHTNIDVDIDLLRHMILNSLRSYNVKFRDQYGKMIIACDGQRSWRKDVSPYYKANRKKSRDSSELDWNKIFEMLNQVRDEIKEHFPYPVIMVNSAEADDVIGALCKKFGNTNESILIVSGDKDFRQLQQYMNVRQYDPVNKKWIQENDPSKYLKEHIMRGDTGDGVCNFLSPDNSLVLGVRQKSVMQKKLDIWVDQEPEEFCTPEMLSRYRQNEILVDLSKIPEDLCEKIYLEYEEQINKKKKNLLNYFIEHKLKNLTADINDF